MQCLFEVRHLTKMLCLFEDLRYCYINLLFDCCETDETSLQHWSLLDIAWGSSSAWPMDSLADGNPQRIITPEIIFLSAHKIVSSQGGKGFFRDLLLVQKQSSIKLTFAVYVVGDMFHKIRMKNRFKA